MLQIRNVKGEVTVLNPGSFIEICDLDGKPAMVFFQTEQNKTHIIEPGTKDSKRYEKMFNLEFCKEKAINLPT